MIVVLDSGIWISAFQFGGVPQAALDSVFRDHTIAIYMVFECAVMSQAAIIVTGDNDLLSIANYNGIQVLTARRYLDHHS